MSVQIVKIDLLGASFTIQTDESIDYMEGLILRLRERFDVLRSSVRVSDPLKLSILTNIMLLDELLRERSRLGGEGRPGSAVGGDDDELSRVAARLIAVIDQSLDEAETK